jgi:hypothetical protein
VRRMEPQGDPSGGYRSRVAQNVVGAAGETKTIFFFDRNTKLIAVAVMLSAVVNLVRAVPKIRNSLRH